MTRQPEPHGVPGQLNVYVLDVDSEVTAFGRHNRLVVMRGTGDELNTLTIREDLRGLPLSTDEQRRAVACHPAQRLHAARGRLVHLGSEPYKARSGESIEHTYRIEEK